MHFRYKANLLFRCLVFLTALSSILSCSLLAPSIEEEAEKVKIKDSEKFALLTRDPSLYNFIILSFSDPEIRGMNHFSEATSKGYALTFTSGFWADHKYCRSVFVSDFPVEGDEDQKDVHRDFLSGSFVGCFFGQHRGWSLVGDVD